MSSSLHFITTLDAGGAEKQLVQLVKTLKELSHTATVVYLKGSGQLGSVLRDAGIRVIRVTNLFALVKLGFLSFRTKNLVIHGHLPRAELISWIFSLALRRPLVVSKHNTEEFYKNAHQRLSHLLARFVNRRAIEIICISQQVKSFQLSSGEISAEEEHKLKVIYYGITLNQSENNYTKRDQQSPIFKIMTACRFVDQKYPELIILAVSNLCLQGYAVKLGIYGDGPKLNQLKELCSDLGLNSGEVTFFGIEDRLESKFRDFDLFVLATHYEGFGLVALEAAAHGLPILVSGIPVMQEIWRNPALLFSNDNPEDLTRRISNLLDSPIHLSKLKEYSTDRAFSFDIKEAARITLEVYKRVVSNE